MEDIKDWYFHFDKKLLIIPEKITIFINGIGSALLNVIYSICGAFLDLLTNQLQKIINYLNEKGKSLTDSIKWVSDIRIKIVDYFDSLVTWTSTKAIEFFTSIVEPIILIFLDMIAKMFKDISYGLLTIPGQIIVSIVENVIPNALRDLIPDKDWNNFMRSLRSAGSSFFDPVRTLLDEMPELV
jgi:uncharacterized FlaG/YvyC family protein